MHIKPIDNSFGIEIDGVDLATCGPETHRKLVDLFERHGILIVRGQTLSPADQMAFTEAFGTPETNHATSARHPAHPEILVISNKVVDGKKIGQYDAGIGWHTDSSYLAEPVKCTMLYAMEVPDEGSDTIIADLCAAWNALSPERQATLDGLQVRHSWRALMQLMGRTVAEDDPSAFPDVVHPLVRTHPADGRKALWVSTGTTLGIVDMPNPAGLDLLEELVGMATAERFLFHHKWRVGDVLVWDNRCTLHTGTHFDTAKYVRHVHRTWVKGDRPV